MPFIGVASAILRGVSCKIAPKVSIILSISSFVEVLFIPIRDVDTDLLSARSFTVTFILMPFCESSNSIAFSLLSLRYFIRVLLLEVFAQSFLNTDPCGILSLSTSYVTSRASTCSLDLS